VHLAKEAKALPINLEGLAVFHCGPVMRKQDGVWVAVAAGPTTSTRLEAYESAFIRHFKPRLIVGKGGMGEKTTEAMLSTVRSMALSPGRSCSCSQSRQKGGGC